MKIAIDQVCLTEVTKQREYTNMHTEEWLMGQKERKEDEADDIMAVMLRF